MKKGIQFYLDYEILKKFKIKCIEADKQPSRVIEQFLSDFCRDNHSDKEIKIGDVRI